MLTHTFKVVNNDIIIIDTQSNKQSKVSTYLSTLSTDDLQSRFFCDIIKDSQTGTNITNIIEILKTCFSTGKKNIPNIKNDYHTKLISIERQLDGVCKPYETILKNILNTDTIGSNTKISYADTAFWESGFGIERICVNSSVKSLQTSAAVLDPISKDPVAEYYNPNVIFDNTFVTRLGFVGISQWSSKQSVIDSNKSEVEIIFNSATSPDPLQGTVTKGDREIFANYCQGNNEKNGVVNNLYKPPASNCDEIVKYLVIKELGDVAQVWMYLAYVCIVDQEKDRTKSVMITTDNVVYTLCKLLHLSCINTGSREGVLSGHCTLKHYLSGDVDYNNKFKVMIKQQSERILQHNQATNIFFARMSNKIFASKMQYLIYKRGKEAYAYVSVPPSTEKDLTALAQTYIGLVTGLTYAAQSVYNKYEGVLNLANDLAVNAEYDKFFDEIIECMCKQYFTKLPNNKFVILNTDGLLSKILDIIYAGDLNRKPQITGADFAGITNYEPGTTSSASSSGGANTLIQSSKSGGGGDFSHGSQDYYECLVLCYTKYTLEQEFGYSIDVYQYPTNIYFPVKYSQIAYEIEKKGFKAFSDFFTFFDKITDDEIMTQGAYLNKLVFLAGDREDETIDMILPSEPSTITTSSSNTNPFSSPQFSSPSDSTPSDSTPPNSTPPNSSLSNDSLSNDSLSNGSYPYYPLNIPKYPDLNENTGLTTPKHNDLFNEPPRPFRERNDFNPFLGYKDTTTKKGLKRKGPDDPDGYVEPPKMWAISSNGLFGQYGEQYGEQYGGKNKKTRANKTRKTKNANKTRKTKNARKDKLCCIQRCV